MNQLHVFFTLRNQRAFQRLLDGNAERGQLLPIQIPVGGVGKSWTRSTAPMPAVNVNARDWLGRTVLHLACGTNDPSAIEYLKLLLAHPAINVNLCDMESNWTALHRALYAGNIPAALLLLQRSDTDATVKDFEGYTAFDLYNSTVEGTNPSPETLGRTELFTWGSNRNASLGSVNADDRTHPELIVIPSSDHIGSQAAHTANGQHINVREVVMSKFHTAVVTDEARGNLLLCGFGTSGRLGQGHHTHYVLQRIPEFTHTITAVALGQDHTLALTASGEVLSWGSNRCSQLGYVIEPSPGSTIGLERVEEPVQSSPRKIYGHLRKEIVRGVAASKVSSACWTSQDVFTWGTNNGQLGHNVQAHPVQTAPRKVSRLPVEVVSIAMSDHATVCLSSSREVFCIWNDKIIKLSFPPRFPADIQITSSPRSLRHHDIKKVMNCENVFAALSQDGELFIFTVPNPLHIENASIKPQRVWALRKKFTSVKDVALGGDGTIIICTESGHVFCRSRSTKPGSAKTPKFQRIQGLQRVIGVCANAAGAFGALRGDLKPRPIELSGNSLDQDVTALQPYFCSSLGGRCCSDIESEAVSKETSSDQEAGEDEDDVQVQRNIKAIESLCHVVNCNKRVPEGTSDRLSSSEVPLVYGADIIVETPGLEIPAHRVVLAARSPVLEEVISGTKIVEDRETGVSLTLVKPLHQGRVPHRLSVAGCHPLSILLLVSYLYTEELPVVWDPRVSLICESKLQALNTSSRQIKFDLQALVRVLDLPSLSRTVDSPSAVPPSPALTRDMTTLLHRTLDCHATTHLLSPHSSLFPDVLLRLMERDLPCHSVVLRARSPFFADFFDDPDWTTSRWERDGTIKVDLAHMNESVVRFILRYLYSDEADFAGKDSNTSIEGFLQFAFEVMGAANEMLLDRLVTLCSMAILEHVNVRNACYILSEATLFNAKPLVESIQGYIAGNMETFLESGLLDDMPEHLIEYLATYVRHKQHDKSPVQRSHHLVDASMKNQAEWLALQDIPEPIVRSDNTGLHNRSPKISPSNFGKGGHRPSAIEPLTHLPKIRAISPSQTAHSAVDDIFHLDGLESSHGDSCINVSVSEVAPVPPSQSAWKTGSPIPRVDLKSLMAEAEGRRQPKSTKVTSSMQPSQSVDNLSPHGHQHTPQRVLTNDTLSTTPPRSSTSIKSPWQKQMHPTVPPHQPSSSPHAGLSSQSQTQHHHPPRPNPAIPPSQTTPSPRISSQHAFGKAWNMPPVQSATQPSLVGPPVSLVAIQEMQLGLGAAGVVGKRSLLEIQEEEQAHQQEAEFLKWWSAEEQRVRVEEEELALVLKQTTPTRKQRKSKGKLAKSMP